MQIRFPVFTKYSDITLKIEVRYSLIGYKILIKFMRNMNLTIQNSNHCIVHIRYIFFAGLCLINFEFTEEVYIIYQDFSLRHLCWLSVIGVIY